MSLRITEIFHSLQGEARSVGLPTVFVRLTGCPQRCVWCDTEYAFHGGERLTLDQVVEQVAAYSARHVTVTGGEPLAQPAAIPLMHKLVEAGYQVSVETGGKLDISEVPEAVSIVLDLKAPASGEQHNNRLENIPLLKAKDQVKFVLMNRSDYEWAKEQLALYQLDQRAGEVLFSPVFGELDPTCLAEWILEDGLPVRFQLQLHKLLWQDARGK